MSKTPEKLAYRIKGDKAVPVLLEKTTGSGKHVVITLRSGDQYTDSAAVIEVDGKVIGVESTVRALSVAQAAKYPGTTHGIGNLGLTADEAAALTSGLAAENDRLHAERKSIANRVYRSGGMWALEWQTSPSSGSGIKIIEAKRPTEAELSSFAEWFRPQALYGCDCHHDLEHIRYADLELLGFGNRAGRPATHSFPGCNNHAWIITDVERYNLVALNFGREREARAKDDAAKLADRQRRAKALAQAQATNEPVELGRWMTDGCHARLADCSFDLAVELIVPDGSIKVEYTHCF
jgi:hypothetical protein